jgi:hypothetical protein
LHVMALPILIMCSVINHKKIGGWYLSLIFHVCSASVTGEGSLVFRVSVAVKA